MQSIVTLSGVSFEFSTGCALFNNLNFSLETRITALVGPNGVGKTCLAKLLVGELEPTEGAIRKSGEITFFRQREEPKAITVDEYLSSIYTWSQLGDELLFDIDRKSLCVNLSGGQWMRVRLACAIREGFLILDEPTNDLDRDGREVLLQFLKKYEGGILLISHDRECLNLCSEVLELSNQGLSKFGGGWSSYEEAKGRERSNLESALESAKHTRDQARRDRLEQKEKQEKRNRNGIAAAERGGMPKILLGARKRRAQVTTGKIDASTLERANESVRDAYQAFAELKIDPIMYADLIGKENPAQKLIAEAQDFNVKFQDWVFASDLSFSLRGNARCVLRGANGAGKSTLLKAIRGENFRSRGELRVGKLATLYIDQRLSQLDPEKSIFENVRDVCRLDESEIRNGLARFLFTKDTVFQKIETLSGGERLRAALACGLMSAKKPALLILDEPTNNLDLANIEFLEKLVAEFKGAVLVVSHDEVFLGNCRLLSSIDLGLNE